MSYNYLVTAHKATLVTAAITGSFTGPDDLNLIQAKGSNLVISLVTAEGLRPILDVDVFGRITSIQLFRPETEAQDFLFLLTARYHIAILSFDSITRDVVTRGYGDIKDRVGKPTFGRQVALIDPKCHVIALHLYAGLIKVVPLQLDSDQPLKAFDLRLDDLGIIAMQFLDGSDIPTILYLAEETTGRFLKTFQIFTKDQELTSGPWKSIPVEPQANLIWPVPSPYNGMLVVGMETIAYYSNDMQHCIDPPIIAESVISCIGSVDHSRYLLGDSRGRLLMLFLDFQEAMDTGVTSLTGMRLEVLGDTSIPYCLSYLDNGVVFIGSTMGDSQLVKLTANGDSGFVEVMESFTNIGPILDMSIVDLDKQGRDLLVCCSGTGKDGSLRIIKSGIGINESASIDLSGIRGIWSLHCGSPDESYDNTIILSFVGQTTALSLTGEEVEETELPGLASDLQTFYCANGIGGVVIQITSKSVRLIDEQSLSLICEWCPPDGRNISTATCNLSQVVVAIGSDLFLLEVKVSDPSELIQISHSTMDHEIACVDINPLGEDKEKSSLCAIGLWTDISVQLLTLPQFDKVFTQPLGGDIIPRSVLMVEMGSIYYLLCALGDGCLYYYTLDPHTGQLGNSKRVILGTKPVILRLFESGGTSHVFACSDHPTIIHPSHQKLLFSNVNVREVDYICTLNSEAFQDSLALVDSSTLVIGSVDQIQMLHIDTISLGESPRYLAYQESTQSFLVGSYRIDKVNDSEGDKTTPIRPSISTSFVAMDTSLSKDVVNDQLSIDWSKLSKGEEIEMHSLLLFDQSAFELQHVYPLYPQEHVMSLTSCTLLFPESDGARVVYVVGTALVKPEEKEAKIGRVLVFQNNGGKLELIHQKIESGAVYQVKPFSGKLLISVNSAIHILKWTNDSSLVLECSYTDNIIALYLKTKGDFILVGDILRSLKLLVYKNEQGLEEIGIDIKVCPSFCTAIEMIDDENFIAADGRHIYICQKNTEATVESEMLYMLQPSRIYIGDNINVFGRGSLVMEHPGSSASLLQGKPLLFGTVHGAIGLIGQLNADTYNLLVKLQLKMADSIKSVGNIEHEVYRSFSSEHRTKPMAGFIDGDLVEKFLDLPRKQMEEIVRDIKITDAQGTDVDISIEDILKIVEDLSRLH